MPPTPRVRRTPRDPRARVQRRARALERVSIDHVITSSRRKNARCARDSSRSPTLARNYSNHPGTDASAHVDAARHTARDAADHDATGTARAFTMSSFALARDAKIASPATTLALCPTMDLVVVACALGRTLTAYRLNWNKLWTKTLDPERETPTRVTFRPDGKVMTVGYASGTTTTHATETGESLLVVEEDDVPSASGSEITCAVWREVVTRERAGGRAGVRDESRAAAHASASASKIGGGRRGADISGESGSAGCLVAHFERTGRLSVLLVGNARGTVTAYAFGMFRVGRWTTSTDGAAVEALAPRDDFESVDAVIRERAGGLKFMRLDTSYIASNAREVYLLSTHASHVKTALERALIALDDVRERYATGYRDRFDKMLQDFERALDMTVMGGTSDEYVRFEFRERFVELMATGVFDIAFQQFFMNSFKSGLVKRMAKDIDALLTDVHEILIATLAPLVDETALRLNALRGLARLGYGTDGVGIDETRLEDIIKMCERLSFVIVDVARAVTVRAMQLRAFFVCIIRTQLAGEGEKGYEAQLPAPRLDLVRDFLEVAFSATSADTDVLDRAFARATDDSPSTEEALRHFSRACSTRGESVKRLDDLKPSEIVSLGDMLDHIVASADTTMHAPCEMLSAKCAWTDTGRATDETASSVFATSQAADERRHSVHVDASRDRLHVYRAVDGDNRRSVTFTTPNESIVDCHPYKGDALVLLLKPKDAASGAKARLVLVGDDVFESFAACSAPVDINSLDIRSRQLPCVDPSAPLAVSVARGLAGVLVGAARVQLYDLEDDEMSSDSDDEAE